MTTKPITAPNGDRFVIWHATNPHFGQWPLGRWYWSRVDGEGKLVELDCSHPYHTFNGALVDALRVLA